MSVRHFLSMSFGAFVLLLLLQLLSAFERLRWTDSAHSQLAVQRDNIDRQLSEFAVLPSILAADPRLIAVLQEPSDVAIASANDYLKFSAETSLTAAIFVMATDGNTIAASNFEENLSFVGSNYAFRPYFKGALQGLQTTFFAVGATTGIPGYFVANPIESEEGVIGVVVVKIEPSKLSAMWSSEATEFIVSDELAVSILSTNARFLYSPSTELAPQQRAVISAQRRYPIGSQPRIEQIDAKRWSFFSAAGAQEKFSVLSMPLRGEPWHLHALQSDKKIRLQALLYLFGLMALFSIAILLWRIYRQKKQLSLAREEQSKALERLVLVRTKDLETAQQALIAESNFAMLGRMSAAINHEINQPLASLRLNLATLRQIVQQQSNPEFDIQEIVVESDRTTKRIGRVIETLRSLARQGLSRFEPVDLQRVVIEAVDTVKRERPVANDALASFDYAKLVQGESADITVPGNDVLLQQAVLNLLYNALDAVVAHASVNPCVSMVIQREISQVTLTVTDNGIGVSPEMELRLFKPFESESASSTGLGLGLTLARQIAQDHGGSLNYKREEPHGSSFMLSLPVTQGVTGGSVTTLNHKGGSRV